MRVCRAGSTPERKHSERSPCVLRSLVYTSAPGVQQNLAEMLTRASFAAVLSTILCLHACVAGVHATCEKGGAAETCSGSDAKANPKPPLPAGVTVESAPVLEWSTSDYFANEIALLDRPVIIRGSLGVKAWQAAKWTPQSLGQLAVRLCLRAPRLLSRSTH
jgi:hypothetical protein